MDIPFGKIIIALSPVPLFYLLYLRYFTFESGFVKHVEAFLSGVTAALFLTIISPYIYSDTALADAFSMGFLRAALLEKTAALVSLLFFMKYFPGFSVMEAVIYAMLFGLGFSSLENFFYVTEYGYSIVAVRVLFSVPLHVTTCGMIGYYLGNRKLFNTGLYRNIFLLKAAAVPLLCHGLFDSVLLMSGFISYLASALIIYFVFILELMLVRSQGIVSVDALRAMGVRFEDWLSVHHQPKYERWILQSMGRRDSEPVHFFLWRPTGLQFFLVVIFFVAALVGASMGNEISNMLNLSLSSQDKTILFGVFPLSIGIMFILVGAINPYFFRNSEMKIPIISDVEARIGGLLDETLITYDITPANCFLRTSESYGIGTEISLKFECPGFSSGIINGIITWENHADRLEPFGSVVRITNSSTGFITGFITRYYLFRLRKGILFNLKLPGFESARKFFVRPVSTMQTLRFYDTGDKIFEEGDEGNEFYLLKKGRVAFYKKKISGEMISMGSAEAGSLFGELSVLGNKKRATTGVCETDCIIAFAEGDNLDALIRNNVEFSHALVQTLAGNIKKSEDILIRKIHELEQQRKENERLSHAVILFLLVSLGNTDDEEGQTRRINIKKISEVVSNMGDEEISRILALLMKKNEVDTIGAKKIQEGVIETLNDIHKTIRENKGRPQR